MNISPVNFANLNFCAHKNPHKVPYGIDYSSIDEFRKNDFSKFELATAAIDGRLTQEMIDEMILDRIPKTLNHAKRFVLEHPEFDEDETFQQLIAHVVELAHKYKGQQSGNFNNYAYCNERYFLETLAKKYAKEQDWQEHNADIRNIKDNQIDLSMRELLNEDVRALVGTLCGIEQDVIRHRYGIGSADEKSLDEVANMFCVPSERITQIENAAIRHMSHPYRIYDICEDIAYIKSGDDASKRALLSDRNKL